MQPPAAISPKPRRRIPGYLYPLFVLLLLPLLVLSAVPIYNWSAERDFVKHVAELRQIGESVRIEDLRPEPLKDLENTFIAHPLIAELIEESRMRESEDFDPVLKMNRLSIEAIPDLIPSRLTKRLIRYFEGTPIPEFDPPLEETEAVRRILEYCETQSTDLAAFAEATKRPLAHFNLRYEDGLGMSMPELHPLDKLGNLIALRAKCALASRDSQTAFEDTLTLLRLADQLGTEPVLVFQLFRLRFADLAAGVIHEGLQTSCWDAPMIESLSRDLKDPAFDVAFLNSMRMERASFVRTLQALTNEPEMITKNLPDMEVPRATLRVLPFVAKGWIADNSRRYSEIMQEQLLSDHNGAPLRNGFPIEGSLRVALTPSLRNPVHQLRYRLATLSLPAYNNLIHRFLRSSVYLDHSRIALALESHRIDHGSYPPSLLDLTKLENELHLTDPITGEPYHYALLDDGSYLIYSVGLNRIDESGLLKRDFDKGDWVWRLKLPSNFDEEAYRD